jgi:glycerol-3-phosphate cytidylyltransferase-like family protein
MLWLNIKNSTFSEEKKKKPVMVDLEQRREMVERK